VSFEIPGSDTLKIKIFYVSKVMDPFWTNPQTAKSFSKKFRMSKVNFKIFPKGSSFAPPGDPRLRIIDCHPHLIVPTDGL
jgi:hypothetical protein